MDANNVALEHWCFVEETSTTQPANCVSKNINMVRKCNVSCAAVEHFYLLAVPEKVHDRVARQPELCDSGDAYSRLENRCKSVDELIKSIKRHTAQAAQQPALTQAKLAS